MKRFAKLEEVSKILHEFTGVTPKITQPDNNQAYTALFDSPNFVPLSISMDGRWVLDEHRLLRCPLQLVQSEAFSIDTGMPIGVYFTMGELSFSNADYSHGNYPRFTVKAADCKAASYFLVLMCQDATNDAHKGHTGWQPLPLLTADDRENHSAHCPPAWQATSAISSRHYWEAYLLPVGYCRPSIKDGECPYTDHSNNTIPDLSPILANAIRQNRQYFLDKYNELLQEAEATFDQRHDTLVRDEQIDRQSQLNICNSLNQHIDRLREETFFTDLEYFHPYGTRLTAGNRIYGTADAWEAIRDWQDRINKYKKFLPQFHDLFCKVHDLGGWMNTNILDYVEVCIYLPEFDPQEKGSVTRRFRYSERGVAALKRWLEQLSV